MPITISGSTGIAGVDGSASTPAVQGTDTNTGIAFPAADTVAIGTGGTERMRVDSSGNVGIGTSSPASPLQVSGTARFGAGPSDATNATVAMYSDGTGISIEAFQGNNAATKRNIWLNAYGGNILIGTTSDNSAKLQVVGNVYFSALLYCPGVYNQTTGSAVNMHIATDGNIFRSTSSRKYKRDIQDATFGLSDVLALRPVTYRGNSAADGEIVFGGLIAEEVHDAGLTQFVQYAEDGTPDALAYGNMVALCIKAIQELKAENDDLKARLTALEAK
jgi:hypothetical protein